MSDSKVFMFPDGMNNAGGNSTVDPNLLLTTMNNGGGFGNGNWIWIMFMFFLFGWNRNGFGGNGESSSAEREMLLQAINGNGQALGNLATKLNCDVNSVQTAINQVQSAICGVGNQVGLSGQQVINAIQQGNMTIAQQMAQCCCDNKMLVTNMGYEGQLRDQTNTCNIINRISELANGVQTGFAQIGYNQQVVKNDIIQASNLNTQRIVDTLNNHWTSELQQKYADAKLELSQQSQNAYLISQLKTTA